MAKIVNDDEIKVFVDIYLGFLNALIKEYGSFKMSQDLHNMIIRNLAQICAEVEKIKKE